MVAVVGVGFASVGASSTSRRESGVFDRAYLFSFIFFVGLSLGLAGPPDAPPPARRGLGLPDPPPARTGAMTLPLMAVLFIPI